jgi:hypothetical protein
LVVQNEPISRVNLGEFVVAAERGIEAVAAQRNQKIAGFERFHPKRFPPQLFSLERRRHLVDLKHAANASRRLLRADYTSGWHARAGIARYQPTDVRMAFSWLLRTGMESRLPVDEEWDRRAPR